MFCENCGKEIPDDSQYCPYCNTRVAPTNEWNPTLLLNQNGEETQTSGMQSNMDQRQREWKPYPEEQESFEFTGGFLDEDGQKEEGGSKGLLIGLGVIIVILVGACIFVVMLLLGVWDDKSTTEATAYPTLTPTPIEEVTVTPTPEPTEVITVTPNPTTTPIPTPQPTTTPIPQPTVVQSYSSEYVISDSSTRVLTTADLSGLSEWNIKIARNEIYARHGRIFKSADLDEYFRSKSWYSPSIPAESFQDSYLNTTERANVNTIVAYEKAKGYNQ